MARTSDKALTELAKRTIRSGQRLLDALEARRKSGKKRRRDDEDEDEDEEEDEDD